MIKNILFAVCLLFLSSGLSAQSMPSASGERPAFSGFGDVFSSPEEDYNTDGYFGSEQDYSDYSLAKAEGDDSGFGEDPDPGQPGVPIIESFLALLGLGGAYAWRVVAGKRKKE